ncbi:MAG: peptidase [Rhizobiales bacterium]|nr:peptidase [Hyphomicrobiales bacterium]
MMELVCATVFPGVMAFAGTMDLFTMTIPNRISIVLVVAFFVIAPFAGLGIADIAVHTATFLGVLGIGIFMFARGWMGGGDAKIIAAASLWIGPAMLGQFIVLTAICGGVLTLVLLAFRRLPLPDRALAVKWIGRLHACETGVPYGIAIAGGALLVYPQVPWIKAFVL